MLDSQAVAEFLRRQFEEVEMEMPRDVPESALVEAFRRYVEDDYYEWLKDNFESFFNHGNPDWRWIREGVEKCTGF